MSTLAIHQLSCFYQNNQVLDGLTLALAENEIICLLGESGCGKTTLLKAVAGLQNDLAGSIKINHRTVYGGDINIAAEQRKVGFIFQDYALFPHLTVFANIAFSLAKLTKNERHKRVHAVLDLVRLSDYAQRYPHQLSGGQQQRVAIARALAYQPELMLLDEPFSNLDHHVRLQLIAEIRALFKARKMSALFVTHSKEEGFAFADKIALMQAGKIVQVGSAKALYSYPNSKYVADFMGVSNYLRVQVVDEYRYQSDFGLVTSDCAIAAPLGQQLSLLLRPEQIAINACEQGVGVVTKVEFLGAYQHISVKYLHQHYCIKQDNQALWEVGDKVSLMVINHHLVTFAED